TPWRSTAGCGSGGPGPRNYAPRAAASHWPRSSRSRRRSRRPPSRCRGCRGGWGRAGGRCVLRERPPQRHPPPPPSHPGPRAAWQWLPLVGADFPLAEYARRGPVVAWTANLAGVALKVDRKPAGEAPAQAARWLPRLAAGLLWLLLIALVTANLVAIFSMHRL